LTGLFHWKLDTSDSRTYSLKPEDYPRLPLFTAAPEKCVLLNQVFWLVWDDASSWRSMSRLSCNTVEEVEHLAESQYVSIAASKSGPALKAVPKISKHLVAYMAGLGAVSPYMGGPFDPRVKGIAEQAATQAFNKLNRLTAMERQHAKLTAMEAYRYGEATRGRLWPHSSLRSIKISKGARILFRRSTSRGAVVGPGALGVWNVVVLLHPILRAVDDGRCWNRRFLVDDIGAALRTRRTRWHDLEDLDLEDRFPAGACEIVSFAASQSRRLFIILNSVISALLFPQKDKLC